MHSAVFFTFTTKPQQTMSHFPVKLIPGNMEMGANIHNSNTKKIEQKINKGNLT